MLTGENGILTQTGKTKDKTSEESLKEEVNLMFSKRKIEQTNQDNCKIS